MSSAFPRRNFPPSRRTRRGLPGKIGPVRWKTTPSQRSMTGVTSAADLSRSEREERLQENLDTFDCSLEEADKHAIFRLTQEGSHIVEPPRLAPVWGRTPPTFA